MYFRVLEILLLVSCIVHTGQSLQDCDREACKDILNRPWTLCPNFENGQNNWSQNYTKCNGTEQSPINITHSSVTNLPNGCRIKFSKIDLPLLPILPATLHDYGYALVITGVNKQLTFNRKIYIYDKAIYQLSCSQDGGTDHSVDVIPPVVLEEQTYYTGLLVNRTVIVSTLYVIGNASRKIAQIIEAAPRVRNVNSSTLMEQPLDDPNQLENVPYYLYNGSLSMPPCTEGITRIVLANPQTVTWNQVSFLGTFDVGGNTNCPICDNSRPVQPLNTRRVDYCNGST